MKDPEVYLRAQNIGFSCQVDEKAKAVVSGELRRKINWELYFFSDTDRMAEFDREPLRYCGRLTDPVTKMRFRPDASSPRLEYDGRPYYFVSDSTRAVFENMPAKYADPDLKMAKKPAASGDG